MYLESFSSIAVCCLLIVIGIIVFTDGDINPFKRWGVVILSGLSLIISFFLFSELAFSLPARNGELTVVSVSSDSLVATWVEGNNTQTPHACIIKLEEVASTPSVIKPGQVLVFNGGKYRVVAK